MSVSFRILLALLIAGFLTVSLQTCSDDVTANPDSIRPALLSTYQTAGDSGVSVATSIRAVFSEEVDENSVNRNTFSVKYGDQQVKGSRSTVGNTVVFSPDSALGLGRTYTVKLQTGIKDMSGNHLIAASEWSFTTSFHSVTSDFAVLSVAPGDRAERVKCLSAITVAFTSEVDSHTVDAASFIVNEGQIAG